MAEGSSEINKLQNHLRLLREEYVKLQQKHADLDRKYQMVAASGGQVEEDSFVSRLLKIVSSLFDKELYSDLTVKVNGQSLKAHKFVLSARSDSWGVPDLSAVTTLDFSDVDYDVVHSMLKWVYTDQINISDDDISLALNLLRISTKFKLKDLQDRCENALLASINVKNCITFYQTAEEINAEILKKHCSEIISNNWNEFTSEDFENMPAPLLYKMFKTKSSFPLHTAIRAKREDVVFLYLVEHDSMLPGKLDEIDSKGDLPLDLALKLRLEGIAQTLIGYKVNVNKTDNSGKCLLYKAVKRGDEMAASFLITNKADVNLATHLDKETPLHVVASYRPDASDSHVMEGMAKVAQQILDVGGDVNAQDSNNNTAIHLTVDKVNTTVFDILLEHKDLNLELRNADGQTVLWLALQSPLADIDDVIDSSIYNEDSFAARLIGRGSSPDAINSETGDSILHIAARQGIEVASLFLVSHGANINHTNNKGEAPLHTACKAGLIDLVQLLLDKGANPNSQTMSTLETNAIMSDETPSVYRQSPLHLAIENRHRDVVQTLLDYKAKTTHAEETFKVIPNFNLKDSQDQTPLALALWNGMMDIATQLLGGGANINDRNSEGLTLLHQAMINQDTPAALFLLENSADINLRTLSKESALKLAIQYQLLNVVDALCTNGVNMNETDDEGYSALWHALDSEQDDIASTLVKHNCDRNMWGWGPDRCYQNLLHKAIDESKEDVACFLIRSGCDINSPRRLGPNGEGGDEAKDGQTPMHLASSWGMEQVVQSLMEHNADVNAQDTEGRSPIHIAIDNESKTIIMLLLAHPAINLSVRDKKGSSPFATAMLRKNNKAAQAILDREPRAAEQLDNKGRNFLHIAIQNADIESVLFLISIQANVNSRVNDAHRLTPLHLAVLSGSEIIVRNLLLAGASVNELTSLKQTPLHLAAERDQPAICSVLLESGINADSLDDNLNNALHVAVQYGTLNCARVLLTESSINAEAPNMRGLSPIHVLGQYGKENAAAIFELFLECMPDYPINMPDVEGNSVLLLAYINGNSNLCRAIIRAGACLGTPNKQNMTIFNAPVATKQLLFKLLDMLAVEPQWSEGENCFECGVKFGIKTRKHHCRHCGRLLCSKCSCKDIPIIKFNLPKPVRVCEVCFDVLTLGSIPATM